MKIEHIFFIYTLVIVVFNLSVYVIPKEKWFDFLHNLQHFFYSCVTYKPSYF